MKASKYPLFTQKNNPSDAEIISHKLMLKAGLVRQQSSGQYSFLPIGYRVLKKIENIIREEMNAIGSAEILMPSVQPSELWEESGRWETYGLELLRLKDRHQRDYCLGPTFEEVITDLVRKDLNSYKQLPINMYQISSKFRDEIRPRFGIMRAREFIMKDAYSFHLNQECLDEWYENYKKAYNKIFTRLQLEYTMVDADSGNIGGSKSNEFHVIADTGEDDLLIDQDGIGVNYEIAKTKYNSDDIKKIINENNLVHKKGIEVGHIFKLGDKYSKAMNLSIADVKSKICNIEMGCYGIGVSRIIAAAIEQNHDDKGIVWPETIAPFKIVIIEIDGHKNESVRLYSSELYEKLSAKGVEVILDDRNSKLGNKLNDWELIGVPNIVIVGKSEAETKSLTFKKRGQDDKSNLLIEDLIKITSD
ncbi:proline--tRNA ligase [Gammaproteobacteria bacterium]|nr:proline--tRNA ligase [Gammaproteobacteria bacterium]